MHRDEVHLVLQLFDQGQLVRQLGLDFFRHAAGVTLVRALSREPAQALGRCLGTRHDVLLRIQVELANFVEVETAARSDFKRGAQ